MLLRVSLEGLVMTHRNMTIFSFLGTTVINGSQSGMGRTVFHITQWGLRLKTSNLTIRDAPADLGGAFQCIGQNNAGKVLTKLNLGMNFTNVKIGFK